MNTTNMSQVKERINKIENERQELSQRIKEDKAKYKN